MVGMRTDEIAFGVALIVLFLALSFLTEMMRRQVHEARYGNQQIGPSDVRFVNDLLGQNGIWDSHKRLYRRSRLRACFLTVIMALLFCFTLGAYLYFQARQ